MWPTLLRYGLDEPALERVEDSEIERPTFGSRTRRSVNSAISKLDVTRARRAMPHPNGRSHVGMQRSEESSSWIFRHRQRGAAPGQVCGYASSEPMLLLLTHGWRAMERTAKPAARRVALPARSSPHAPGPPSRNSTTISGKRT